MGSIRAFFAPPFVRWTLLLAIATAGFCWWGAQNVIGLYATGLQLAAILLVFHELQTSVQVLSPGRLKADMAAWWTGVRTGGKPPPIHGEMNAREVALDGLSMTGFAGTLTPDKLDERVKRLEQRMSGAEKWLGDLESAISREARARAAALEAERLARADEIRGLRHDVVKASVADPWKTIFGIVCLFVGVALSGLAPIIAGWRNAS